MSKKTAVATKEDIHEGSVVQANTNLPAHLARKAGAPIRGVENVTQDDLIIPRLEVVQALSPCRKKQDPAYIEGIEEGMLYNSVTREIYGSKAVIVPVSFKKEYLLWKDRKQGGGFKGIFDSKDKAEEFRQEQEDASSIEVVDTAQHFCLLIRADGKTEEIALSLAKSKMKMSKTLNSLIRIAGLDSFAKMYTVSAVMATNANNEDYWTLGVVPGGFVPEDIYQKAESLYSMIEAGNVVMSTDFEKEINGEGSESTEY